MFSGGNWSGGRWNLSLISSMSGYPRVKPANQAESEVRPVLGPAGNNKERSVMELRKPVVKPKIVVNKAQEIDEKKAPVVVGDLSPSPKKKFACSAPALMRHQSQQQEHKSFLLRSNLSMNASCSSDASTDSSHSRASTGRISRRSLTPTRIRRKPQCGTKTEKVEKLEKISGEVESVAMLGAGDDSVAKKRCAWVTPNTGTSNEFSPLLSLS